MSYRVRVFTYIDSHPIYVRQTLGTVVPVVNVRITDKASGPPPQ